MHPLWTPTSTRHGTNMSTYRLRYLNDDIHRSVHSSIQQLEIDMVHSIIRMEFVHSFKACPPFSCPLTSRCNSMLDFLSMYVCVWCIIVIHIDQQPTFRGAHKYLNDSSIDLNVTSITWKSVQSTAHLALHLSLLRNQKSRDHHCPSSTTQNLKPPVSPITSSGSTSLLIRLNFGTFSPNNSSTGVPSSAKLRERVSSHRLLPCSTANP